MLKNLNEQRTSQAVLDRAQTEAKLRLYDDGKPVHVKPIMDKVLPDELNPAPEVVSNWDHLDSSVQYDQNPNLDTWAMGSDNKGSINPFRTFDQQKSERINTQSSFDYIPLRGSAHDLQRNINVSTV